MAKKDSSQTTPRLVKEVPAGYKKEVRDGKTVYVKVKETPIPKTPVPVKPTPTKTKPSGTPKRVPPPTPKPVEPDFKAEEDVVYLDEPTPKETVLKSSVQTYANKLGRRDANQTFDTWEFASPTGNTTNDALRANFEGNKEVTFDAKGNKVYTGKTLEDFRNNSIQQIETPMMSGVNKLNPNGKEFSEQGITFDKNSSGGMGVNKSTLGYDLKGATDTYVPKKYDLEGKEIPTNNGLKPIGTGALNTKEAGKMYDVEQPVLIKGAFKNGGIVSKIKGYYDGGPIYKPNQNIDGTFGDSNSSYKPLNTIDSGVVGMNDQYSAQKAKEEQDAINENKKKSNQQKARNVANGIGEGMGGVGTAYYNSQPTQNEGEATRNAGLAATSQMGGIGGMIGGIAAIGDKLGKPTRNRSEKVDASGNLVDENKAKRNAAIGITFSPSKRLTYEGGLTDVTGQKYLDSIENKTKKQLAEVEGANKLSRAQQAILARNNGEENPTITNPYNLTGVTFDENQNMILADGQQFDPNRQGLKKGGIVSKIQMCSDGGKIVGKGTGKSDSILAKVEADSFIVPAKNAKVAEELREKFLGKPPKQKANLNDKNGELVKLSNGEHKFTPEEKHELLEKGVNVDALAPDSKVKAVEKKSHIMFPNVIGLATGGDVVEEDTVDPIKELARLNKEKEDAVKAGKVESDAAKAARDKKIADFNAKVASYDRKADRKNKASEWEKKRNDSKTKLDALNKSYEDASKSFEAANTPTAAQKAKGIKAGALNDTQRKYQEDLLKKIQEAKSEFDNADRTYNYVKDDNNYDASGNIKVKPKTTTVVPKTEVKPNVVTENVATTKPSLRVPKTGTKVTVDNLPTKDLSLTGLKEEAELKANAATIDADKSIANAPTRQAVINDANKANNDAYVSSNPTQRKGGIMDKIGSIDPTSFVGIGQTVLGLNMLGKSKRPIDKAVIDPTYNTAVNRAQQDALFGLTPEQRFAAEQDIQGGLNDAKMAGLNSSGVQSFNLNRAAINDAWRNKLGLKQADSEMRMNKQKYADAMAADRANILSANRRQAYNDAMNTFQQNQQAGSELVGAGLQNTIGAYRFNKIKNQEDEVNAARNPWINYKP